MLRHERGGRVLIGTALGCLMLAGPLHAGPEDGEIVGTVRLVDHGPDAERFDIVLLSEGYRHAELGRFADDADSFVERLFASAPFDRLAGAVNVWRIDVASAQSGADDPWGCTASTGRRVATFFDGTFCAGGVYRGLVSVTQATVFDVLAAEVPAWEQAIVLVNSEIHGTLAGSVTVASRVGDWERQALHQIGHAAFGLADEYAHWDACDDSGSAHHPAVEPVGPNVSAETDPAALPWADLLPDDGDPPGTANEDCSTCDRQADPYPGQAHVGRFEGAHHAHCDAYRPAYHCMMRDLSPFCPVCSRRIEQTLASYLPAGPNGAPTCDAGGPYVAACAGGTTAVTLDGGACTDPDDDPLSFLWSGPFVGGAVTGSPVDVRFDRVGQFVVDLTVSDGGRESVCATVVEIEDTTPPTLLAPPDVTIECAAAGGSPVDLEPPFVEDGCDRDVVVVHDAPARFAPGTTLVTWTATDRAGNRSRATQRVTVVDTMAPALTVSLSPEELWPPNHHMRDVEATISVSDACDAAPAVVLASIVSSELDDGVGDGATPGDIENAELGTDDRHFRLRAERAGGGGGRVYTVTHEARDAAGNRAMASAIVRVPEHR